MTRFHMTRFRAIVLGLAIVATATGTRVAIHARNADVLTLGVAGRSNATPWIAASGSFVAVAWGASAATGGDVFVAVSRDSGQTFGPPVQVNAVNGEARLSGEIAPRVHLVRRSTPGSDPEIAVLWNAKGDGTGIKTSRSRDGGRTFEAPTALQASGAPGDRGWQALTVDGRGTAHAIWLDHRGLAENHGSEGGTGTRAAHAQHQSHATHDGSSMAQRSGLYYASTTAEGPSSAERELAKGVCYCCKTAFITGPDDTLYAAWRHVFPGDLRDMAFTTSRDGGRSFSPIARVSEDGWAINGCPDDGPAMAASANGTVHIVWPTAVGGENPKGALFYASTSDGRSFAGRTQVPTLGSLKPSHPQIVVDGSGRVFVAWDEYVGGRRVGSVREVTFTNGATGFGPIIDIDPEGTVLYPVLAATDGGLVAVWTTGGERSTVHVRQIGLP